jgi:Flp pilus assembly protein TadD
MALRAGSAFHDAADAYDHAVRLVPADARGWAGLGMSLLGSGRSGRGMATLRRALALDATDAEARNALGAELLRLNHPAEAAAEFHLAAAQAPGWWVSFHNLGLAEQRQGRHEVALGPLRRAAELAPGEPEAWQGLGAGLLMLGRPGDAERALRRALALNATHVAALANLGRALRDQGRLEEAAESYAAAISAKPDHPEARWNLALVDLLRGRFREGWDGFEWRWRLPRFPSRPRGFPQPLWGGEGIAGRRILLHAEQGFGDSIQFLRYVPMVAAMGAEVVLEVQPDLLRLVRASGGLGAVELVATGAPLPGFDLHAPLLSLPRAFGTTVETIPGACPYLSPDAEADSRWAERLPADGGGPRIGLVWAGRPTHTNDPNRSIGLEPLLPLIAAAPGLRFVSLQVGPRAMDPTRLGIGHRVADLSDGLTDFTETAAALRRIDLLVCVDTAVAHLAGALGRPVRLLLPFAPDWRWLVGRDNTPWYPTMRLLRQDRPGAWGGPLSALAAELLRMASLTHAAE